MKIVYCLLSRTGEVVDSCHADDTQDAADQFADEWDLEGMTIEEGGG